MKFIFQKCAVKCLLLYTATLTVNIIWAQTLTLGAPFTQRSAARLVIGGGGTGVNNDGTGSPNGRTASGSGVIYAASGQTFFSKVITIQTVLSKEEMLDINPVPAKKYTMIKWSSATNSKLTITMFDATGRFVLCRQYQLRKGVNELLLTNLEALPAGVYSIKASDGASYRNGKLRIQQ